MSNVVSKYNTEEHKRTYGAYLYDRDEYAYWCTGEQYCKAKDYDLSLPDTDEGDAQYFDWFDKFTESEGIKREAWKKYIPGKSISSYWTGGSKSYASDEDDYTDDGFWGSYYGSKGGKSAKESNFGFKAYSENIELAAALQAAQSVVDVISDDENLLVRFIGTGDYGANELSYTIFENGRVMVNPQPLLRERIIGLDLTSGLALHEGSHGKWTNKKIRAIDAEIGKDPKVVAKITHYLANLLEDVRIEKNLVREYPGFREYLQVLHDWIWTEYREGKVPEKYGDLSERAATMFTAVRYPEKCGELTDPSFNGEIEWWQKWAKKYKGESNLSELVYEGYEHLLNGEEPPKEEELQKVIPQGACHSGGDRAEDMSGLDETDIQEIEDLVLQELEMLGTKGAGGSNGQVTLRKPLETDSTKSAHIRNDPLISRMKEALIFRQAKPQRESNLLEDGDLDEEELYRIPEKDYRVFKATSTTEDVPEVAVALLVDASGSMHGWSRTESPMSAAHRVATIMVEALKRIKGASPMVFGYTTGRSYAVDLTRVWEPGDPETRLGILKRGLEAGGTPTGVAIKYLGERINRDYSEKDRIMIVLSDGVPDDDHAVKTNVDTLRKTGMKIMQVAVGAMSEEEQAYMFGDDGYIPLKPGDSPASITVPLSRWLKKFL